MPSKGKDHSRSAWAVVTGLVIAAVTAIAALIGVLRSNSSTNATPSTTPQSTHSTSTGPTSGSPTPTSTAISSAAGSTQAWHRDKMHFPYQSGIDIDAAEPTINRYGGDFTTANYGNNDVPAFTVYTSAGGIDKANPTFSECREALVSDAVNSSFTTRVGRSLCVQSRSGNRLAAITVLTWDSTTWEMDAAVTVWDSG